MKQSWWTEVTPDVCLSFQADLSALADGELDSLAATRAVAHLEVCAGCHDFFDDVREMARAHRDLADPDALLARVSSLTGQELFREAESKGLSTRLATIFYQLGKAYVLLATDDKYRLEIFEPAVKVESEKTRGRGFVDGVLESGRGAGDVDWDSARHMLNGRLTKIEGHLEKGKRLLEEALSVDADHEEARLYRAFVHAHEGRRMRAAEDLRYVFDTAMDETNRGHAAVQLGKLYGQERDDRRALVCFRWVTISGLADVDPRFYFVRYNAAVCYLNMGHVDRSLDMLRELLDRHPGQASRIADALAASSPKMQERMATAPGFAEGIIQRCPELFDERGETPDPDAESLEDEAC